MKLHALRSLAAAGALLILGPAATAAACFAGNPLQSMTVTSPFGQRFHPVRQVWTCHCGLDLRARIPQPMLAVDSGIVQMARVIHGGGNTIELRTDSGIVVQYMHASMIIRQMGDRVAAGELLGQTGNTGEWTTGPHLHLVTKVNGSTPVDPSQFLCSGVTIEAGATLPAPPPGVADPNAPVNVAPGVTGISTPPMASFPSMGEMGVRDFLYSETHKRFMNPQWYQELEHPGTVQLLDPKATAEASAAVTHPKIHMLRELNTMQALRNMMAAERSLSQESIEARLAALLSLDAKNYSEKVQAMIRQSMGKSR